MSEIEFNRVIYGDCIEEMKKLPENSVDAIVTDPPYGLEFMGKNWDKFKDKDDASWESGTMGDLSKEGDRHKLDTQKQGWGFKSVDRGNQGRFPANIILDEEAGKMLDEQSGISISEGGTKPVGGNYKLTENKTQQSYFNYGDKGGASRFFYTAKSSSGERNYGCEELEEKEMNMYADEDGVMQMGGASLKGEHKQVQAKKNIHPTVKPITLMEYLIKLVTPKEAVVLDPFLVSGTTAIACLNLNRKFIGMEKEEEYVKIAEKRIKFWEKPKTRREVGIEKHKIMERAKQNKQQKVLW